MVSFRSAEASAPAKVILFGEHAVVYGLSAIAAPLSTLRAHAVVTPTAAGAGLFIDAVDLGEQVSIGTGSPSPDHTLARAALLCLSELGIRAADLTVRLTSQIPIASGLGSGAALTAALMRALVASAGAILPDDRLNELVYEVEREFHGTPSGIDNTVVVFERAITFVRGERPALLAVGAPFTLIVADTGVRSSTREAVAAVRALVESDPAGARSMLNAIGQIAGQARGAIAAGHVEDLGALMTENHALLGALTVSSPELDHLVQAALNAGAWGAKLSGGGRGGNMIALAAENRVAAVSDALRDAGAVRVMVTRIEAHA